MRDSAMHARSMQHFRFGAAKTIACSDTQIRVQRPCNGIQQMLAFRAFSPPRCLPPSLDRRLSSVGIRDRWFGHHPAVRRARCIERRTSIMHEERCSSLQQVVPSCAISFGCPALPTGTASHRKRPSLDRAVPVGTRTQHCIMRLLRVGRARASLQHGDGALGR